MLFVRRRLPALLLTIGLLLVAALLPGCISSQPSMSLSSSGTASSAVAEHIPYEAVDRREFADAGVRVRTTHGNRVSVEAAANDTLVWFENEHTGRFTRAYLRRGNTIYVLARDGDYFQGLPSQTVAYRMFMQAWHRANETSRSAPISTLAEEQ